MEFEDDDITVKDIMNNSIISVDATLTANEAAKMMEDAKVGAVIVMENNTPIGIVTDRDFAIKIVAHAYQITTPVKQIMSSPLIATSPDKTVLMAANLMYTRNIRKLPVIDNDKVVGMVIVSDLVKQLAISTEENIQKMYHETIIRVYKQYNPYNQPAFTKAVIIDFPAIKAPIDNPMFVTIFTANVV